MSRRVQSSSQHDVDTLVSKVTPRLNIREVKARDVPPLRRAIFFRISGAPTRRGVARNRARQTVTTPAQPVHTSSYRRAIDQHSIVSRSPASKKKATRDEYWISTTASRISRAHVRRGNQFATFSPRSCISLDSFVLRVGHPPRTSYGNCRGFTLEMIETRKIFFLFFSYSSAFFRRWWIARKIFCYTWRAIFNIGQVYIILCIAMMANLWYWPTRWFL